MQRAGEVHCYLCGDVSGIWEWPATASPEHGRFRPLTETARAIVGGLYSLRCGRCGGSVYLEVTDPVKVHEPFDRAALPAPRRGRPPKCQPLAS
jgi:hypothetical protein